MEFMDDGNPVKLFIIGSWYININTADDIKLAEKTLKKNNPSWKKQAAV